VLSAKENMTAIKTNFETVKNLLIIATSLLIISCNGNNQSEDHLSLKDKLAGKWKAKAFSGELHEEWKLEKNGWMQQRGYYIEKNDTSYSAITRIEKIGNDVILFSVIKNSNPKIFKAISTSDNKIVFENKDYKNPYQVKYEFFTNSNYRRTIMGYENDSLVTYEFNFKKLK